MSIESGYTALLVVHRPEGDLSLVMETWEDGELDSDEVKHRNPVTRKQTARGGQRTRNNLKMQRECDAEVWALRAKLEDSSGRDRCTAIKQMVGPRGEAIGEPFPQPGIFKMAKFPNYDLSGDAVGMLEVEISTDE